MEQAVQAHGGMINKFLGDGFLALFGLPIPGESIATMALRSAVALVETNVRLNLLRTERGDERLEIGVGIHLGNVIAGNIGSTSRSEYTVIGDTVNLASRIEGLSKRFGVPIVCSDDVLVRYRKECSAALAVSPERDAALERFLTDYGRQEIRGRAEPVRIWAGDPTKDRPTQ